MSNATEFSRIFAGLDRAHGTYDIPADAVPDAKGKIKGKAVTHPYKRKDGSYTDGTVTLALWEAHLAGTRSLGIVPIRDDGTCVFGAIDIDVYPLDLSALYERVVATGLPLIMCRTKSGGAHLYLFTDAPVPAPLIRAKLREWATALGYPAVEIFPKQDAIIDPEKDAGNWINMPYFDGDVSMRYAQAKRALTMIEFFNYRAKVAIADADALLHVAPAVTYPGPLNDATKMPAATAGATSSPPRRTGGANAKLYDEIPELPGAPPCLTQLAIEGFPSGAANNGLFSLMVYAKKAFGADWETKAREFAARFTPSQTVNNDIDPMIKAIARKDYGYKCKDTPICDVCDRKTCATRSFGVGGGAAITALTMIFGKMTKVLTKPVTWLWEIDGELLDFETADLMIQKNFQARLVEALNLWPPSIKPGQWRDFVQSSIAVADRMEVPDDATAAGQLWDFLTRFCTSRVAGRSLDELLMGKPYTDPATGRSYFIASDFVAYLVQHRFPNRVNERIVYLGLRDRELEHHRSELKGKTISYWSVPAFKAQTQDHAVPRETPQEAF